MWLGVLPANGLAYTADLNGPGSLLKKLDNIFKLPKPENNWDF